jgi:uncharacterized OsmC-like protein
MATAAGERPLAKQLEEKISKNGTSDKSDKTKASRNGNSGKNGHADTAHLKQQLAKVAKAKAARDRKGALESTVVVAEAKTTPTSTPTFPARPTLRDRQSALKQKYRVRPDSALLTSAVYSVTEPGSDPTRVKIAVDGPNGAVLEIGAHHSVGGPNDIPCSGDIFLASLAGCQELTIRLVAAALGLPIHRLDVRVEGDWDVRGTLGTNRESPIGYTAIRVNVNLETEGAPDRIERLLASAERFCVVGATLHSPPPVSFNANVTLPDPDA